MKKEYYIPLAIIIGTIIIGVSIYLGTTLEYRDKKALCEDVYGKKFKNKDTKDLIVQVCLKRGPGLEK